MCSQGVKPVETALKASSWSSVDDKKMFGLTYQQQQLTQEDWNASICWRVVEHSGGKTVNAEGTIAQEEQGLVASECQRSAYTTKTKKQLCLIRLTFSK